MKNDLFYLLHIRECLDSIDEFTGGDKLKFFGSKLVRDAVLRNLQTMVESATNLSEAFKARHPEMAWTKISGFRNVVVHNYLGLDLELVWAVIEIDLPALRNLAEQALDNG